MRTCGIRDASRCAHPLVLPTAYRLSPSGVGVGAAPRRRPHAARPQSEPGWVGPGASSRAACRTPARRQIRRGAGRLEPGRVGAHRGRTPRGSPRYAAGQPGHRHCSQRPPPAYHQRSTWRDGRLIGARGAGCTDEGDGPQTRQRGDLGIDHDLVAPGPSGSWACGRYTDQGELADGVPRPVPLRRGRRTWPVLSEPTPIEAYAAVGRGTMHEPRGGGKVLVTEDNPLHMKIFALNLTYSGFSVIEAQNGEKGLELAHRERPDLILVDLSLPKIDGWEMIRRMQEDDATKDIPIIVVSARRPQDEAARAAMAQVAAYIAKPFDPEALMALIQQTIHGRRQATGDR